MPRWDFTPHGTIVDEETFDHVSELETRQAVRLQYAVSMLTIHASGNGAVADPPDVAEPLATTVSALLRNTDLIEVVPSVPTVRVLLVGGALEDLRSIAQRIIAEVGHVRLEELRTLVVCIGGSCFPATAGSSRELLLQADAMAEAARREQHPYSTYQLRERVGA